MKRNIRCNLSNVAFNFFEKNFNGSAATDVAAAWEASGWKIHSFIHLSSSSLSFTYSFTPMARKEAIGGMSVFDFPTECLWLPHHRSLATTATAKYCSDALGLRNPHTSASVGHKYFKRFGQRQVELNVDVSSTSI